MYKNWIPEQKNPTVKPWRARQQTQHQAPTISSIDKSLNRNCHRVLGTTHRYANSLPLSEYVQGCGNTMPDLSDLVPFYSGQVENFYLLFLGQVQMYKVNEIFYFILWLVIMSSHVALKTVWILISWLLHKSWYLVSYCFRKCKFFKHRKIFS